jgi:hypothetical protein
MKSNIVVGPIQKSQPIVSNPVASKIQENLKKMRIGNFFEVKGLADSREIRNLRAGISYFSRRNQIKVSTSFKGGVLTVTKTKKTGETQKTETV